MTQGVSAVAVTSGANMNFDRLRLVTELAGIGALKEAMLATTMPERQGSFKDFLDIALDDSDLQITEFKYRCAFQGTMCPLTRVCCSTDLHPTLTLHLACRQSVTVWSAEQQDFLSSCERLAEADKQIVPGRAAPCHSTALLVPLP